MTAKDGKKPAMPSELASSAEAIWPPDLAEEVLLELQPIAPPADRAEALKASLLERVRMETVAATRQAATGEIRNADTVTIRAAKDDWVEIVPRVKMKRLHRDGDARTYLLRLEPGGVVPGHRHDGAEECLVVEGEVSMGELSVAAGDYHVALAGSVHPDMYSRNGALLFIRSAAGVGTLV